MLLIYCSQLVRRLWAAEADWCDVMTLALQLVNDTVQEHVCMYIVNCYGKINSLSLPLHRASRMSTCVTHTTVMYALSCIWLLKICASVLTPTITNIVSLSLSSGQFHPILKESVISPLLKKPRQRPTLQLPANLQLVSHIQDNWTCCKISTYWSPCLQWSSQSSPVCLLQASLNWNSSTVYPWSSHQCHWITEVVLSLPPWSFCRFRHHRP